MTDMTPEVESLIRITGRLVELMQRETEHLDGVRLDQIEALQQEKAALAANYDAAVRALANQGEVLKVIAPALKDELAAAARAFDRAAAENLRRLAAARTAHDRLVKAIVDAVTEKRSAGSPYAASGGPARVRLAPGAVSVALDRRL
jgi:hypothetical protein